MTEGELSKFLQLHGWYLNMVRKYRTRYAYAKKRFGSRVRTRYIMTERKFDKLTKTGILRRLEA